MITETNAIAGNKAIGEAHRLKRMIVAHDASTAADKALNDAVELAKRFKAELLIAHIQSPDTFAAEGETAVFRTERHNMEAEIHMLVSRLETGGLRSRGIVRAGAVGDTLFNLCCEESADLLLMGAYGRGSQDRQTLGSTAEQLLRAVPCAVLTYGPITNSPAIASKHLGPALLPVSLPMSQNQLKEAIALAKLFGDSLEVFHAVDKARCGDRTWFESECRQIATLIREHGVKAEWSYMYGQPDIIIRSKVSEIDSPLIVMPLRWRKGLSAITSDNVAAHVIRRSAVPVLSYRCD